MNTLRLLTAPLMLLRRLVLRRRRMWVHLRLDRRITELRPVPSPVRRWLFWAAPEAIVLSELDEVGACWVRDPHVDGVVVEIPQHVSAGWATLVGLRELIEGWRARGKRVVAYLPDGGGTREIFVALAADAIWLAPEATLAFLGVAGESMYLKPLLDRLGVSVQVHAAGRFKTAAEPLVAEQMSEAQRHQRQALLDTLHRELTEAVRRSRNLDDETIARLLTAGLIRGAAAVEARLVDGVCYPDQLMECALASGERASSSVHAEPRMIRLESYRRAFAAKLWRPLLPQPYIAVIPIHGTIGLGGTPQGGANVPAITTALSAVRRDPRACAVVLHIDSPGGSALASDHIHREVSRLAKKKPVVACFGDVAASGGYYVAAPARRIIAQPTTVTGSIGVISAKIVVGDLLQKIGVRPQVLTTAPHADMFSLSRGLDAEEHAIMEREAQGLYRTFLGIVAEGRGRPVDAIEALAAGRVWSGRDALTHGLVDRLGGFATALEEARALVEHVAPERRRRIEPRIVTSFARARMLPNAPEPSTQALNWIAAFSPEIATLIQAQVRGERLLLLAPWLRFFR